jgi:hypothetical protein
MPSGWDVYYVVFLSAALALGIPAGLSALASLIRSSPRSERRPDTLGAQEASRTLGEGTGSAAELGRRLNTRFFRSINAALLLLSVGLVLIPCVSGAGDRSLIGILSLASFGALGLFYAARKGDLDWLKTHVDRERP